ncbi:MAG: hypothetical protein IIW19_03245, partial [Clostridia bacterium]|nr:hypothetical protein [Clostridia bacterium]
WTLEGEDFNLVVEGEDCPGTLKDGVITFDFAGSGITLVFAKDGKIPAEKEAVKKEEASKEESKDLGDHVSDLISDVESGVGDMISDAESVVSDLVDGK